MQSQLKAIKTELSKGKSSAKVSGTDELQFLMDFISGNTQAMAKTLEHLTDFVLQCYSGQYYVSPKRLILVTSQDRYHARYFGCS